MEKKTFCLSNIFLEGRIIKGRLFYCSKDQVKFLTPIRLSTQKLKNIQEYSRRMRTPVGADHNKESQGRNIEIHSGRGLNSA